MSTSAALDDEQLVRWREVIEGELSSTLEQLSDCPTRLREAMSHSLLAGGKRLRPLLVLMACEACGGRVESAMPAAVAIELVHTYSLIHDDLPAMDDDDLRRGRPTCHVAFDEATAILAGDGLLTLAFEVVSKGITPAEVAIRCCADLSSAAGADGMVGGQMRDLTAVAGQEENAAIEQLEAIHRTKTGRLLSSAVTMGGLIAGANVQTLGNLQAYGNCIGLGFQIVDDLLDERGDAQTLGKEVRKDAAAGKLTYPTILGVDQSRRRAEELIETAIQAIEPLGQSGRRLQSLARYILKRDH